ncbi:proline iminopeptidase [Dyadobacter soli]|uniref:Proline iminopeptidase n=2 Tax=Dyadobacter soli TaxID=659014 RepID=A0A1G7SX94_9BACT|nr:proline iminopeptidase [Dyadobacter soli]
MTMGGSVVGQALYSRAFGKKTDEPVIFLHGGPGSSAVYFEATTAQKLADKGFYVLIYDRRGEGRSVETDAKMTYDEFFTDLNSIYKTYNITRAHLIGFSFGGLVTALYAEKYPEKVKSIVLVSALVSQQASYHTILDSVERIYRSRQDSANLQALGKVRTMDTLSLAYRTEVFAHASRNGFFSLQNPDPAARRIYATYNTDTLIKAYVKNEQAVGTLWKNEARKNIDTTPVLKKLTQTGMPIYAIYGKQDGLYSKDQIADLQAITGQSRLKYLDNCSHTAFIDQQAQFLEAVGEWLKPGH